MLNYVGELSSKNENLKFGSTWPLYSKSFRTSAETTDGMDVV